MESYDTQVFKLLGLNLFDTTMFSTQLFPTRHQSVIWFLDSLDLEKWTWYCP